MKSNILFFCIFSFISISCLADDKPIIRIGVQANGTVDWELSAVRDIPTPDFRIEVQEVGNAEAGKIALQSGSVDMIVTDWLWVAKLRQDGFNFSFYPYSATSGALVVPKNSPIHSVSDLKGKRLGITGGELDKNWLLLQALAQKNNLDLNTAVEKTFGAPPLISEQLKQDRVDAALTYWHFAAKLEAEGYKQLIDGKGILKGLDLDENVPTLGYVFKEDWGLKHKQAINSFFKVSKQAKKLVCTKDSVWKKIIPLTKVEDSVTQNKLRQRFCQGSIEQWDKKEQLAAERIYTMLRVLSNSKLTGKAETLPAGTFWSIE